MFVPAAEGAAGFASDSVRSGRVYADHLPGDFEPDVPGGLPGQAVGVQLLLPAESVSAAVRGHFGAAPAGGTDCRVQYDRVHDYAGTVPAAGVFVRGGHLHGRGGAGRVEGFAADVVELASGKCVGRVDYVREDGPGA
uniref:(northern house mosquito) hypothetical protein n=1 Tax=Culex pipiens TaxID=7175 RepID=A0A8D8NIJ6_CULPI